jgi:hypothetical protein
LQFQVIPNTPKLFDRLGPLSANLTEFDDVSRLAHDLGSENEEALPPTFLEVTKTPLDIRSQVILADVVRKLNARWADPFE